MNSSKAIGLGEPEVVGKKSLFQPPQKIQVQKKAPVQKHPVTPLRRVRMTLEMTFRDLAIVQEAQSEYRLKTGCPLPKWKIIGDALELYEKMRKGEGSEKR
jgi:hypothetical protein